MTRAYIIASSIDSLVLDHLVTHNNIRKIKIGNMTRVVEKIVVHDDLSVTVRELKKPGELQFLQSTFVAKDLQIDLVNNVLQIYF